MRQSGMFSAFTDRARSIISHAMHASHRFRHDYIGSEHLLLGILAESDGVAMTTLRNLAVDPAVAQRAIEALMVVGPHREQKGPQPFTPQAKAIVMRAAEASRSLGHPCVGTEHLLLGLMAESDCPSARILVELGATPERVRAEILELLGRPATSTPGLVLRNPGVSEATVIFQGVDQPFPGTIAATTDSGSPIEIRFAIPRSALERMLSMTPEGGEALGSLTIKDV